MSKFRKNELQLIIISSIELFFVFASHYLGIKFLMIIGIFSILISILILPDTNKLPILLCFLPWIEVLKINHTQPTLYHFIYIFFIISILLKKRKMNIKGLIMILFFCSYVFSIRLFSNIYFDLGFIAYIISIIFLYLFLGNIYDYCNVILCIDLLYLGIITSFIAERFFRTMPNLQIYLSSDTYDSTLNAIRYAGLFNDSNFASVMLLITICFTIKILGEFKVGKTRRYMLNCLLIIVVFLGFYTSSKMFLIGVLIIGFNIIYKNVKKLNFKKIISFIFISLLLVFIFLKLGVLDGILLRMNDLKEGNGDFSNGRIDIIISYFRFFYQNTSKFLFGIGMYDRVYFNNISTHNTWISSIYQMGIVGTLLLYCPMIFVIIQQDKNINFKNNLLIIIIFSICCTSLDLLMNEAFSIYVIIIAISSLKKELFNKIGELNYENFNNSASL